MRACKAFFCPPKDMRKTSAQRFPFGFREKAKEIHCRSEWGSHFSHIIASDSRNPNISKSTSFCHRSIKDIRLNMEERFTGRDCFQVKETEMVEITD
jgi:hypothetical protein